MLESGQLIDTVAGQTLPPGAKRMPRTSPDQVAALRRASREEAERLVWRAPVERTEITTPIIGDDAPLSWPHPFTLERLNLCDGLAMEVKVTAPEVLFVQSGHLKIAWADGTLMLEEGDTMTVPIGLDRTLTGDCKAYRVSSRAAPESMPN